MPDNGENKPGVTRRLIPLAPFAVQYVCACGALMRPTARPRLAIPRPLDHAPLVNLHCDQCGHTLAVPQSEIGPVVFLVIQQPDAPTADAQPAEPPAGENGETQIPRIARPDGPESVPSP